MVGICLRVATADDVPVLRQLIDLSVRRLQAGDYTPKQIEFALQTVFGVDSQLISDGTYLVAEIHQTVCPPSIVGCGGWSKRKTLFGGDHWSGREPELLDPKKDAAKIRSFFIHPEYARRGIGTMILKGCEDAAAAAGFTHCEMAATLTGVKLFQARGYVAVGPVDVPLSDGSSLPVIRMGKQIQQQNKKPTREAVG